ncbi:hypothetical protein RFI_15990 [Reticulomyxa filosa]|uniref:Coatomer subunit zeta n=1 Tax=Reticulomyxa filosa TaxID=46433 RepID=X6N4J5_RETFI|nr:hypothetical protein RFI_15990 [Reticulomyxa filosa]|eukprot:ETO21215.1 hypothetical protein RFI_15990 [Reticulomyxa filosa]
MKKEEETFVWPKGNTKNFKNLREIKKNFEKMTQLAQKKPASTKSEPQYAELAPQVEAIVIADANGNRLCAKYYCKLEEFEGKESQTKFETGILNKINRSQAKNETDVMLYNDHLVLFKSFQTVRLLLIASPTANELIMDEVLKGLEDALNALLR